MFEDIFVRFYYNEIKTDYFINPCNKGVYSEKYHKLLKPTLDRNGYVAYHLYINGKCIYIGYHQLVAITFIGRPSDPLKNEVDHLDCDKLNNDYRNLEWVTHQENVRRSFEKGCHKPLIGERNPSSVYTDKQVHELAKSLEMGGDIKNIAKQHNVPISFIYQLLSGSARKDIILQYDINKQTLLKRPISKKATKSEVDQVWTLKAQNHFTMKQISEITGIPFNKVKLIWYYKNINVKDYR